LLYIVYMGERQHEDPDLVTASHHDMLSSVLGRCIWPESRSFDDRGYGPVPSRWKGTCEVGQNFTVNHCNRKIIGARWYAGGVDPSLIEGDYQSPRDSEGHGTHTASTAAGSLVSDASFHGLGAGTARGGAPRARLAIYKVCWAKAGCRDAGVLKAIDDAIHDGVDILSLSLGGFLDPSFASIHAVAKGITVIFAGGNDGPVPQTIANDIPWVITVAASTIDRSFPTLLTLGDNQTVVVRTCSRDDLNSSDVVGKIVLCYDPVIAKSSPPNQQFILATINVQEAGGKGIIFAQYSASILHYIDEICNGTVCVFVDYEIGTQIKFYVANTRSAQPEYSFPKQIRIFFSGIITTKGNWQISTGEAHTANAYGFPIEAEGVPRKLADPFDFGGGHIDPNKAADPGLIYDVDPEDYFKFFNCTYGSSTTCDLVDSRLYRLNLPSISIPDLKKTPLTVWRTVTNVGDTDSIYRAIGESPPGVDMVVEPSLLQFNASTTTHTFGVTFTPLQMVQGDFNFGSLTWLDDGKKHAVRIPIAVRVIIHDYFSDTS
ncbi:hypothetical protein BHM03_00060393, partial [Ensete ventricosum]